MTKGGSEVCEVVVVGGGVIGSSIAYHLTRAGIADVILVERQCVDSGATSRAAALLARVRPIPHQIPLIQRTHAAIRELQAIQGDEMGIRRCGSLHVAASPERLAELRRLSLIAAEYGISCRWIDPREAERLLPWLSAREAAGIALMPEDAIIDPFRLANSYLRAARAKGAQFRHGTEATGLHLEGDRVRGVRTPAGIVRARWVVNATGAWANLLALDQGVGLPLGPVRSHYWIARPPVRLPADMPYAILPDAGAYLRPDLGGLLLGLRNPRSMRATPRGLPTDPTDVSFDEEVEGWAIPLDARERLRRFFPDLDRSMAARFIAGLSTYTPGGEFVVGSTSLDGYLLASSCCGVGIAASGGIGLAIADLLADRAPRANLEPYRPDRLGEIDPVSESFQACCAAARSATVLG